MRLERNFGVAALAAGDLFERAGNLEPVALDDVLPQVAMQMLGVDGVNRVLHALQPVAWYLRPGGVTQRVRLDERAPTRNKRGRLGAEVRPYQPSQLLRRIRVDAHLLFERRPLGLAGLQNALAGGVVRPAVVGAAQAVLLRDAPLEVDAAMRASLRQEAERAGTVAVESERLAEQLHGLHRVLAQQAGCADGVPVAPEQLAHGRPGAYLREAFVLLGRQHRRASL